MHNLMQDWPLRVSAILDHAAHYHADREIISRSVEGPITKTTWSGIHLQAKKCAQALRKLGVAPGDVVGVMAWNTARHLEVWYGVPGAGAVLHTLNPRLFADQMSYVIDHAGDKVLMVDLDLLPLIEGIIDRLPKVETIIVMTDRTHMPETNLDVLCYEELLAEEDGQADWHMGPETDACGICYTSGTTGNPKGVVYTHRSNVLHALAAQSPDMLGLGSADTVMPVVPLFHANGWSIGYTAPMAGSRVVMPGRDMTPPAVYEMLEHGVTITAAVPTIWLGLLGWLRDNSDKRFSTLDRVVIGGSSCPRAVIETFQNVYGVQVLHAWGMTEMSPLGTVCSFKPEISALDEAGRLDAQETVGHPPFTVELKITDDDGVTLPEDGEEQGKLWCRGPAIVGSYLHSGESATDADGWFDTGDVATIDRHGYVRITDRSKDVIKSGGEWISSIDLENAAVGHADVAEAAAVGIPHPKWDERPILVVVPVPGTSPAKEDILSLVAAKFAKWQVPDDVVFVEELPHTATGKISKLTLRDQLKARGYTLPG
ncbi:long-chain-fatty-acid--CoA ligase [Pontivivens insulae]|uniref:3-methylmercaptopropionyl-CoA ligase n=1 Tax=Pontivivens insulae TaxID=1639689 RepID=A0A2R8ADC6_9RHOB|nr:long-chain-fatty-acid--CoA ligase [Pontivivens insulae]RED14192.1 fatty-acyl-CoA synthase [Pontivivens insulae]SPF30267.1 3-methylmercaptopropionyl-CoA ligase [Pontivivens insulae]